jgi:cytochrome oxidase Cu insertion factor (SCO1/SenC/PrrC family)
MRRRSEGAGPSNVGGPPRADGQKPIALRRVVRPCALVLWTWLAAGLAADSAGDSGANLGYQPPAPGSYELPPIQRAADGAVLDTSGSSHKLSDYLDGRVVLLSFIYTHCADSRGCPLATQVLHQVASRVARDPALVGRVRFISLSFDPEHDTPQAMRAYADAVVGGTDMDDWVFLTTASRLELAPILDRYGQYVIREHDARGRETGALAHMLKVFLIDGQRRVRNIYSASFLYAPLLLNDLRTLLLEHAGAPSERM